MIMWQPKPDRKTTPDRSDPVGSWQPCPPSAEVGRYAIPTSSAPHLHYRPVVGLDHQMKSNQYN